MKAIANQYYVSVNIPVVYEDIRYKSYIMRRG